MTETRITSRQIREDGWSPADETWTYASANTFTIAGVDVTDKYTVGTRIKWTQTTTRYGIVVDSSFSTDTTVTIAINTDYVIDNAVISDNFYSYQANPQGYPTWFTYTPLITGTGGSAGAYAETIPYAKFSVVGNACTISTSITVTNVGSWTGTFRVSSPINGSVSNQFLFGFVPSTDGASSFWNTEFYGTVRVTSTRFFFSKGFGANDVQWSDLTANSTSVIAGTYEI